MRPSHAGLFTRIARLRRERGFTVFEVLIAAMIAAIGIMAVVASLSSSRTLVSTAENNEAITHEAEQEMERLMTVPWEELGTLTAPATSTDPTDPRFWVRPTDKYRWNQASTSQDEDLVFGGTSTVPLTSTWSDGEARLSGEIWRFVTRVYDPAVVQSPDVPDAKRIVVAVTLAGAAAPTKPVLLSSIRLDPTLPPPPSSGGGDDDDD